MPARRRVSSRCRSGLGSRRLQLVVGKPGGRLIRRLWPFRGTPAGCFVQWPSVLAMSMDYPTVVDLFAGAGGLSLGFERAGYRCLWAADNHPAAVETFRMNLDLRAECVEIDASTSFPHPTVIVGGPPCQGFSSAGMRLAGDRRNSLISVFAQLVAQVQPIAFVFENVEGILTAELGRRLEDLIRPVVACGYRVHLRKINAANFGAPQHRKRVLAIGGLGFDPTFPEPTHSAFGAPGATLAATHLPLTETVADAIGELPRPSATAPGCPEDHYCGSVDDSRRQRITALAPGQTMRDLPEHLWHQSYRRRAHRRVRDGTPSERRGGPPAGLRRLKGNEPSKAITGGAINEFVHPWEHRFVTLRECARLQTFPDWFVFRGTKAERSALIGNAVPPLLAEVIACQLAKDLRKARVGEKKGSLLSFVPALSNGMSPALQQVTNMVETNFRPESAQGRLF